MLKLLVLLSLCLLSTTLWSGSFLPENDMKIPMDKNAGGITKLDYDQTQNELRKIYSPIVMSRGGNLNFESNWESSTVNAFASRHGNEWRVTFLGGLARHKFMNRDGFSLVICHELGHHLGGAPALDGETAWASIEGQADYFATMKCLRRLWNTLDNGRVIKGQTIPATLLEGCEKQWSGEREKNLCLRMGLASLAVAQVFADLETFGKTPKFETPDAKIVKKTNVAHPKGQCRLDTFFQGSLCEVSYREDFGSDEIQGACHPRLGHKIGNRPLCWFKPK
jgi:hypothetical protein